MFSILKNGYSFAVLLLFLCLSSSCEYLEAVDEVIAPDKQDTSLFLIKKGGHSSNNASQKVNSASLKYEIRFDSSAVYQTTLPQNQGDINKLFGSSDCGTHHHSNSARFGWRWYNNRLEIHAYSYFNGVRSSQYVSTVEIGKKYIYEIKFEDNQYVFLLNDVKLTMPRSCTGISDGYLLYPYFGGDENAPHDITIVLNKLQ